MFGFERDNVFYRVRSQRTFGVYRPSFFQSERKHVFPAFPFLVFLNKTGFPQSFLHAFVVRGRKQRTEGRSCGVAVCDERVTDCFKQLYRTRPARLQKSTSHSIWGASDTALAFLDSARRPQPIQNGRRRSLTTLSRQSTSRVEEGLCVLPESVLFGVYRQQLSSH